MYVCWLWNNTSSSRMVTRQQLLLLLWNVYDKNMYFISSDIVMEANNIKIMLCAEKKYCVDDVERGGIINAAKKKDDSGEQ